MRRRATPLDPLRPGEAILDAVEALASEFAAEFPAHPAKAAGIVVPGIVDSVAGVGDLLGQPGLAELSLCGRGREAAGHPRRFRSRCPLRCRGGTPFRSGPGIQRRRGDGGGHRDRRRCLLRRQGGHRGRLRRGTGPRPGPGPATAPGRTILEAVGSAGAIAKRYSAAGTPCNGAREVLERARAGDALAARIWADAVDALAFTICQCVNIIGTEAVVIGGGLAEAGDELLEPLRARVDDMLDFQRRPTSCVPNWARTQACSARP